MKFNASFALVALPLLVAAAPATNLVEKNALVADKRADCVVNAVGSDVWHEAGNTRRRTRFSSAGTPTGRYCDLFYKYAALNGGSNPQCWDSGDDGWLADCSYVLGVLGDAQYEGTVINSRADWISETGCRTG